MPKFEEKLREISAIDKADEPRVFRAERTAKDLILRTAKPRRPRANHGIIEEIGREEYNRRYHEDNREFILSRKKAKRAKVAPP